MTGIEYATLVLSALDLLKTDIITPNSPGSHIETRYIASEGVDDEQWLGYLRNSSGVVDIWLLTLASLTGLDEQDEDKGSVGAFNKPVTLICDYYADYHQGLDAVGLVGSETVTNTEREFVKKMLAVDLALEKKRGCLGGNIYIKSYDFRFKLRRFEQATTHWASGQIILKFGDIFLN